MEVNNRATCKGEKVTISNKMKELIHTLQRFLYVSIILNIFYISHIALRLLHVSPRQLPTFAWSPMNKHVVTCF